MAENMRHRDVNHILRLHDYFKYMYEEEKSRSDHLNSATNTYLVFITFAFTFTTGLLNWLKISIGDLFSKSLARAGARSPGVDGADQGPGRARPSGRAPRRSQSARLRGRGLPRVHELHAGAERHLHEVRYVRVNNGLQLTLQPACALTSGIARRAQ